MLMTDKHQSLCTLKTTYRTQISKSCDKEQEDIKTSESCGESRSEKARKATTKPVQRYAPKPPRSESGREEGLVKQKRAQGGCLGTESR